MPSTEHCQQLSTDNSFLYSFNTIKLRYLVNSLSSIPCSLIDFFSCLVQVVLPLGVHKEVDAHLLAHLSQKARNKWDFMEDSLHNSSDSRSIPANERMYEQPEPVTHNSVVKEKILQRKSLQLHHQQQDWQVCLPSQSEVHFICCYSLSWHFSNFVFEYIDLSPIHCVGENL